MLRGAKLELMYTVIYFCMTTFASFLTHARLVFIWVRDCETRLLKRRKQKLKRESWERLAGSPVGFEPMPSQFRSRAFRKLAFIFCLE